MELRGSKTGEYLRQALRHELHSYINHRHFAAAALEAGYEQISDILLATAKSEAEHADEEFRLLGEVGDVIANLEKSIEIERRELNALYPVAAESADGEGFPQIAEFFRTTGQAEKRHEKNLREALDTLQRGDPLEGRTVLHSAVDMAQIMGPGQANLAGHVHGGELMKLMDNGAGVAAVRHCHSSVVTAKVEELNFLHPVNLGNLVLVHARLTFVSSSSMDVRVEVEAEDLANEKTHKAVIAHFVMVALDRDRKPKRVPPLIICTEEEERLYREASLRYQARKQKTGVME
jgi:acyl-CoA hydrolase